MDINQQLKIWRPFINDCLLEHSKKLNLENGLGLEFGPTKGNPDQDSRYSYNVIYEFYKNLKIETACPNTTWANHKIDLTDIKTVPTNLNEKYDCLFILEVLEHVETPWLVQDVCKKLLKKNGIIVLSTPCFIDRHPCYPKENRCGDYWRFFGDSHRILFDKFILIDQKVCGEIDKSLGVFSIFRL